MTSVHTLIDDSSGKPIPKGAKYYHVSVQRKTSAGGSWYATDTLSYIAACRMVRRALCEARVRAEDPPHIEIIGRTHF